MVEEIVKNTISGTKETRYSLQFVSEQGWDPNHFFFNLILEKSNIIIGQM